VVVVAVVEAMVAVMLGVKALVRLRRRSRKVIAMLWHPQPWTFSTNFFWDFCLELMTLMLCLRTTPPPK